MNREESQSGRVSRQPELPLGVSERAGDMVNIVRSALGRIVGEPDQKHPDSTPVVANAAASCLLFLAVADQNTKLDGLQRLSELLNLTADKTNLSDEMRIVVKKLACRLTPDESHFETCLKLNLLNENGAINLMLTEAKKVFLADDDARLAAAIISENIKRP
ncbi:MAG: hypothetical protein V1744_03710 [Candidatus Altiarchaeota archaeon]